MTKPVSYSVAFQQGVREEMERNDRIFVLGTDLYERGGHFAQVKGLGPEFGRDKVRDAPISEAAMVAAGVGAALSGARPIVDLNFDDFGYGAMDEISNQAAKARYMWGQKVPLVIRATSGVALGGAQHNNSMEMLLASIPGLAVVSPSTSGDVKGLIKSALRAEDPVLFLMHKKLTGVRGAVGGKDDLIPLGSANLVRNGDDVTIIGYSNGVTTALASADALAERGVGADVIDLRSIYPLDLATLTSSVRRTGRVVIVDEAPIFGSVAAQLSALIQRDAFWYLDAPIKLVTAPQSPIPHSPSLIDALIPGVDDVVRAVDSVMEERP
ncbi:alpha-ketoacid dehydrogenase subunit beta [Paramicrobacterium chengjingii]|uniref:alpha-ketoacid dehydrogenase subunit beta n=1 Tax=Paramicrobacterium chengjingii TaxID=2769067 RepID=UPI00141DF8F4|nr:transketolase C-terminal domain-containing protein [Microbacterium chengjingii]